MSDSNNDEKDIHLNLESLVGLSESINRKIIAGPRDVLDEAAKGANSLFKADYVAIYPYDPERKLYYDLDNRVIDGLTKERPLGDRPRKRGLAAIIRDIDELVVHDVDTGDTNSVNYDRIRETGVNKKRLLEFIRDEKFIVDEEIKAFVGISLKTLVTGGELELGVLYIDYRAPHRFYETELHLIRIFAQQLASAFQLSRLLEREQLQREQAEKEALGLRKRRTEQIARLLEVADSITSGTSDYVHLLNTIVQNLSTSYNEAPCAMRLFDADADTFGERITAGRHVDLARIQQETRKRGASHHVMRSGIPLYVHDSTERLGSGELAIRPELYEAGIRSVAYLPLLRGGSPIGILYLGLTTPHEFSAEEKQVLEFYAGEATIAIEFARLYEELSQIVQGSAVPTFVIDTQNITRQWNKACEKLTSISASDVVGTSNQWKAFYKYPRPTIADLIVDGVAEDQIDELYKESYEKSSVIDGGYEAEDFFPNLGEKGKWLRFAAAPLKDSEGAVIGAIETLQEITERKNADLALKRSEDTLKAIVQGSPVPMFVIDLEHRITHWNEACERLTGILASEVEGTKEQWRAFYRKERSVLADFIVEGGEIRKIESNYQNRYRHSSVLDGAYEVVGHFPDMGGTARSILFTGAPLVDSNGNITGAIETLQDITSELAAEEKQERIKVISETGIAMSDITDTEEVLEKLLDIALKLLLEGSSGQICFVNSDKTRIDIAAIKGDIEIDRDYLELGEGVVGKVIDSEEPYLVKDVQSGDDYFLPHFTGTRSDIAVPLISRGKVIGALNIEHSKPNAFSDDDIPLLVALATQIVATLRDSELRQNRLEIMSGLVELILESGRDAIDHYMDLIYSEASNIMNLDDALFYVAFWDEENQEVKFPIVVENDGGVEIDRVRWGERGSEIVEPWLPRAKRDTPGLTEHVIDIGETVLINESFDKDVDKLGLEVFQKIGRKLRPTLSWLGIPMLSKGKVFGVISIQSLENEHEFDEKLLDEYLVRLQGVVPEQAVMYVFSETKRLAEENERLYMEARADAIAAKQLNTLGIATAALQHRINNSFNIIVPNVVRLRKRVDKADDTIADILDIIERNARYTAKIIARIQKPLQETDFQTVNVNSVLQDAIFNSREQWDEENEPSIEIVSNFDEGIPYVNAPIGQLTEVFNNLTDNACRAMETQGGRIVVSSECPNGEIRIRVNDNGPGIPKHVQDRLFKKPVPSSEPGGGSGLGLWLSGLILESMGGGICVEKSGQAGTTMLVSIPTNHHREVVTND